ncbi:hypothetical protein SprV_0200860900 [Sparganum proliferum]
MTNAPGSASPTGWTANVSVVGGCTSTRVHPQLLSMNAITEGDIQRSVDLFAAACDNFGLIINMEKTVVMHQPPPDAAKVVSHINVNSAQLKAVGNFTFQGSTLSHNIKIDDEVTPDLQS